MPLPDFTNEEQYLISSIKSTEATIMSSAYMLGYMVGACSFATLGYFAESIPMIATGFVILCGFRIWEERRQFKWLPIYRAVFAKYELAAIDVTHQENAAK